MEIAAPENSFESPTIEKAAPNVETLNAEIARPQMSKDSMD
jgi:hypothetical protein